MDGMSFAETTHRCDTEPPAFAAGGIPADWIPAIHAGMTDREIHVVH
jgi:hypothetical protein